LASSLPLASAPDAVGSSSHGLPTSQRTPDFAPTGPLLGLSSHSLAGKLAFLFDPVGVAILAVATLIIGTVGFSLGYLSQWSINRIKNNSPMNSQQ